MLKWKVCQTSSLFTGMSDWRYYYLVRLANSVNLVGLYACMDIILCQILCLWLDLYTVRKIKCGEELPWNYGDQYWQGDTPGKNVWRPPWNATHVWNVFLWQSYTFFPPVISLVEKYTKGLLTHIRKANFASVFSSLTKAPHSNWKRYIPADHQERAIAHASGILTSSMITMW